MGRQFSIGTLGLLLAGTLTACQTSEDPRQAGFFDGISNINSGIYEKRAQQKKGNLASLEAAEEALVNRVKMLEEERVLVSNRSKELERLVAKIEQNIEELYAKLSAAKKDKSRDAGKISEIENSVAELKAVLDDSKSNLDGSSRSSIADQSAQLDQITTSLQEVLDEALLISVGLSQ